MNRCLQQEPQSFWKDCTSSHLMKRQRHMGVWKEGVWKERRTWERRLQLRPMPRGRLRRQPAAPARKRQCRLQLLSLATRLHQRQKRAAARTVANEAGARNVVALPSSAQFKNPPCFFLSSICEHTRIRQQCSDCGGSSIHEHGKDWRAWC